MARTPSTSWTQASLQQQHCRAALRPAAQSSCLPASTASAGECCCILFDPQHICAHNHSRCLGTRSPSHNITRPVLPCPALLALLPLCDHRCTWDAFYSTVSARGLVEGLSSLHAGGIAPKLLIIDDGWQVCACVTTHAGKERQRVEGEGPGGSLCGVLSRVVGCMHVLCPGGCHQVHTARAVVVGYMPWFVQPYRTAARAATALLSPLVASLHHTPLPAAD